MLVAVDLLRHGLYVYRSLTPNSPSDLAVLQGSRLVRVEVTTGYLTYSGKLMHPKAKKDLSKYDLLAVVRHNGEINYYPSLEEILANHQALCPEA